MTKGEIITKAQLYLDDASELSDAEFSDLFDKKYNIVNSAHTWEGTKAEASTTTSTSVPYVALESDFLYLTQNANYTDSSYAAERPVVFRGSNYSPYEVVSWSDRRQYRENNGYAYIDFGQSRLYFTKQPTTAEPVEYDYHKQMPVLGNDDEPWFPKEYHDVLYHMMVIDDHMIQQSPKGKTYFGENMAAGEQILENLKWWNSQLVQM